MFDKIDDYGREMRALQDNIKSAPMSKAINKLYVSIVTFIVSAGSYLKHGILRECSPLLRRTSYVLYKPCPLN